MHCCDDVVGGYEAWNLTSFRPRRAVSNYEQNFIHRAGHWAITKLYVSESPLRMIGYYSLFDGVCATQSASHISRKLGAFAVA